MKKILILLLLAASVTAQAQFTVGINTGFDRFGRGETGSKTYTLIATPNLLLGYRINNRLTVGLTGSLLYYGDVSTLKENIDCIQSVTPAQLQQAAQAITLDHCSMLTFR